MNDLLEFLDMKRKPVICFPLLDETIELLKKLNINEYTINYNILRFKFRMQTFKVDYDKKLYYMIIDKLVMWGCSSDKYLSSLEDYIINYKE